LLTDRSGKNRRRPLVRVVLDEALKTSPESRLAGSAREAPVLIFAGNSGAALQSTDLESRGVEVVRDSANGRDFLAILDELGRRSLQSVLVEGGASVAGKFLDTGLVNKVSFFLAPIIIGGREAPNAISGRGAETLAQALKLENVEITPRGQDLEVTGYPILSEPPALAGG
jgi:diaminohydroxyphosphoribosylaminopyrimidine deaminase/5-amino-6-(5-phosphoribosylamino)uracil reductase